MAPNTLHNDQTFPAFAGTHTISQTLTGTQQRNAPLTVPRLRATLNSPNGEYRQHCRHRRTILFKADLHPQEVFLFGSPCGKPRSARYRVPRLCGPLWFHTFIYPKTPFNLGVLGVRFFKRCEDFCGFRRRRRCILSPPGCGFELRTTPSFFL